MRILFTRFPLESALGGAEIQTLSLMEGLRKAGHDVSFLGSCPTLLSECRKRDMTVTELHIGPPPVTKWGAVSFLWRKRRMRSLIQSEIIRLTNHHPSMTLVMLSLSEKLLVTDWAAKRGSKVLWVEHDRIGRWLTRNPWLPRLRRLATFATTVCVSELSRQMYLALGWPKKNTVTIVNGIDLTRFTPGPEKKNAVPRVGCIARLSQEKGVDVLLEAVAPLLGVITTVVGTGPHEERLRGQIARLRCRDRIALIPKTDIPAFYRSIDIFVLPSSDHDPFGLVAAEAMASGVATVVTDACGIAGELHGGVDAVIVKAGDVRSLKTVIGELADDPLQRHRIAEAGLKTARERFSLERMIKDYLGVLGA